VFVERVLAGALTAALNDEVVVGRGLVLVTVESVGN
jgi:hypothetical protein